MNKNSLIRYFHLHKLIGGWSLFLKQEMYDNPELEVLLKDLAYQYIDGKLKLCPRYPQQVFRAFVCTPLEKVKVVLLGQDPYPNQRQADGLAFSSADEAGEVPKSLQNIQKELEHEGYTAKGKVLEKWARQGVLLLNTCLTAEEGSPGIHRGQEGRTRFATSANMEKEYGYGWECFINGALQWLVKYNPKTVFLALGKEAKNMAESVGAKYIINTSHPSPLSAHKGFLGSGCFRSTNEKVLISYGAGPIDWRI